MENCRSKASMSNIPFVRKRYTKGANRRIIVADGRIYYIYFKGNVVGYCTYNKLLYTILQDVSLSPSTSDHVPGKIILRKYSATEIKGHCTLAELCYACYWGKITSFETWPKELAKFRIWMRNLGFQIDHADSNQLNCTIYNLSVMRHKTNQNKKDITALIKQPTILYSGHYYDGYRIAVFWKNIKRESGKCGVTLFLKCKSAVDYSNCLREIHKLGVGYGRAIYIPDKAMNNDRTCVAKADVGSSVFWQETIANMSGDSFHSCKGKQVRRLFLKAVNDCR